MRRRTKEGEGDHGTHGGHGRGGVVGRGKGSRMDADEARMDADAGKGRGGN